MEATESLPGGQQPFGATRNWIVGLSAVGAANMSLGALRQLGVVHHLPDPPIPGFDSDAVITSEASRALGVPDAPVAAIGLAANVPLVLLARSRDARFARWVPAALGAKAVVEVSVSAWYLVQMRTRLHTWCAYCLAGASINAALAVFLVREARESLSSPAQRIGGAVAAIALGVIAFRTMSSLDARHRMREARAGT